MAKKYKEHIEEGDLTVCEVSCLLFLLVNSSHMLLPKESMQQQRDKVQKIREARNYMAHAPQLPMKRSALNVYCQHVKVQEYSPQHACRAVVNGQ